MPKTLHEFYEEDHQEHLDLIAGNEFLSKGFTENIWLEVGIKDYQGFCDFEAMVCQRETTVGRDQAEHEIWKAFPEIFLD